VISYLYFLLRRPRWQRRDGVREGGEMELGREKKAT
jgi:hypothetical protein